MYDSITGWIRTAVPMAIGWILTWLAKRYEIVLDAETASTVTSSVTFLVGLGWYTAVRALEARWPRAGVLIGAAKQPTYAETKRHVDARIKALGQMPLSDFEAAVAADPELVPEDERDGCACDDLEGDRFVTAPWPNPPAVSGPALAETVPLEASLIIDEFPPYDESV